MDFYQIMQNNGKYYISPRGKRNREWIIECNTSLTAEDIRNRLMQGLLEEPSLSNTRFEQFGENPNPKLKTPMYRFVK